MADRTSSPAPAPASAAVVAERLLERGDDVWLLARSTARAHDLRADHPGATVLVADLADAGRGRVAGRRPARTRSTRWSTPPASSSSARSPS